MSALPPKADIDHDGDNVHFVPQADIAFGRYQFAFCTAVGVHEPSVTAGPIGAHEQREVCRPGCRQILLRALFDPHIDFAAQLGLWT